MRAAIAFAPLALLATSCGGKAADPYAKSLALGSEHIEINGWVADGTKHVPITASGDFTNQPDRGTLTIHQQGATLRERRDRLANMYFRRGFLDGCSFIPRGKFILPATGHPAWSTVRSLDVRAAS